MTTRIRLRQRLLGLVATLLLLALLVGTPIALVSVGTVTRLGSLGWVRLTGPDDGTLALAAVGALAWLAWLVLTVSFAIEATALLRGVRPPRLPGLGVPQRAAGRLIATASLLFVAIPTAASVPAPAAEASVAAVLPAVLGQPVGPPRAAAPADPLSTAAPATPSAAGHHHIRTVPYTVRRGDSLWKIATEHLGDGTRYVELVALNADLLGGHPDFITPGLVLRLPDEQPPEAAPAPQPGPGGETYVVRPGDTLAQIARDELGDSARYPEIVTASEHIRQPDGDHLRDPNLIRPGWRLAIPGHQPSPPAPAHPESTRPAAPSAPRTDRPTSAPAPPAGARPGAQRTAAVPDNGAPDRVAPEAHPDGTAVPPWVLPGLTGSGALLAGTLLLALRRLRRTQVRFRRPGQILVPPPGSLLPVEKTTHLTGSTAAPQIGLLDAVLRTLAAACAPPALNTVELHGHRVTLHLARAAALPAPWTGSGATWTLTPDDPTQNPPAPATGDLPAPYPLLVSLGQDAAGHLWLLNLEQPGSVRLAGDAARAEALARHITAELALNPWASLVDVELLGVGSELAGIDRLRLHPHEHGDRAFLDRLAGELQPDGQFDHAEPEGFRVLIAGEQRSDAAALHKVIQRLTGHRSRSGVAVVTINAAAAPHDLVLELASDGRLDCDALGLQLTAAGLTAEEAAACAAIVEVTRDAPTTATPDDDHADDPGALTDTAGALRSALTVPRPRGPAGDGSLLPLPAERYEEAAATTAEDVATLAPVTPPEIRARVEAADPTLEEDLALWRDADSPFPRLTLLGPVAARTRGDATAVAKRKPFYVELLAFLALHPSGVTSDEVAEAFGITTSRARVDLKVVRAWLGVSPRTGTDHLPNAKESRAAQARGIPVYQVDDLLTDWDLFRRLRARGQARGADGIPYLTAALDLVTGEPFSHLRPAGWSWLLDGDRPDHIATCAIVDVAHIVTSHALAVADLHTARTAAQTGYRAAPDDETSRLDLIQVAAASGHTEVAARQLIDAIFNRSDDDLGPVEVPERTAKIARQRGWDRPRRTSDP